MKWMFPKILCYKSPQLFLHSSYIKRNLSGICEPRYMEKATTIQLLLYEAAFELLEGSNNLCQILKAMRER